MNISRINHYYVFLIWDKISSLYFKRYYYINDFKNIVNGLYQVNLKVDVLMSFKNDINYVLYLK